MKVFRTSLAKTPCRGHFGKASGDTDMSYRAWGKYRVKDKQEREPGIEIGSAHEVMVTSSRTHRGVSN